MMSYTFIPLRQFSHAQITAFWNRAFAGHARDFRKTPESLALRLQQGHADGDHSLVLMEQDRFVGLSVFGRMGAAGEILGFGIDPDSRGRSLARRLIEEQVSQVSSLGLKRFSLEVIAENRAAKRAYEAVGFRPTRDLFYFSGELALPRVLAHLSPLAAEQPLPVLSTTLPLFEKHRARLSGPYPASFERSPGYWTAHPGGAQLRLAGPVEAPQALLAARLTDGWLEVADAIGSREGLAALLLDALRTAPGCAHLSCVDEPVDSPMTVLLDELDVDRTRWTEMLLGG